MFKKIVSQLSFSPALVGQLGFYAKRLRKEQTTRRLGLIFVALALVVQSLVVFQAPEPANASSNNDMVVGGLGYGSNLSLNNFLAPYDRNERHLQDIFNNAGITRAEIAATTFSTVNAGTSTSYGFENRAGSTPVTIVDGNYNPVTTLYGRPMTVMGWKPTDQVYAYVGHSAKAGWFAIMRACGNLITHGIITPPTPPPPAPPPPPTPAPSPANIISSKSGVNVTRGNVDATKTTAKENDKIRYTISVKNTGGTAAAVAMKDDLKSVMQYSKLIDKGGGTFSTSSKILSWGNATVNPGATVTRQYVVQMNDSLINTTTNCSMKNTFLGKTVTVPVGCTTPPANIVSSKSAINVTQKKIDATKTTAKENDKITYTVTVKNTGGTAKTVTMKDDLNDVLTFSKLTDKGDGTLNASTNILSWPAVSVKPNATITKKYTVQINSSLINDTTNCKMVNNFMGKSLTVLIGCKTPPADVVVSKTASNITQGNIDATKTTANTSDRISFTLTAENKGGTTKDFIFDDTLSDVLEYAKLVDNGGGTFNEATQKLTWPAVSLKPGQKEIRTFAVQVLPQIPATPQGISDSTSYDCRMQNTFYEAYVTVNVNCPPPKVIEQVVPELPHTGPRENVMFAVIVFSVVVYFYLRSRQLTTEVRLIRRDVNGGSI